MASIRSRDTKPEMLVRRFLHGRGFRYRLAKKELPGKPDLVLRRYKAVVFVNGCYWHGHAGCRYATTSATRPEFWKAKIAANAARDQRVIKELRLLGWRVAVIWECALRKNAQAGMDSLEQFLRSPGTEIDISLRSQPPKNE